MAEATIPIGGVTVLTGDSRYEEDFREEIEKFIWNTDVLFVAVD